MTCQTSALAADSYRVIDLGVLGISESSYARDINDKCEIAGDLSDSSTFIWDAATGMRYLDRNYSEVNAINNSGQVVGRRVYTDGRYRATMWDSGTVHELGAFHLFSIAYGINNNGVVVGHSYKSNFQNYSFMWSSAQGFCDVPGLSSTQSYAYSINDNGQVAGRVGNARTSYIWDNTHGLRLIDGLYEANDINNSGTVVGTSQQGRAAMWNETSGLREIDLLPNWRSAIAWRINDVGQVVGEATTLNWDTTWFVWDETHGIQVLPQTWGDARICGINNLGQMVGYIYHSTVYEPHYGYPMYDTYHAALWQPVPEPSSLMPLLVGISSFGVIAWSRKSA
ncbi:MAG: PEP-CTERM sorting domain-containing protein [Armatimonadota bacterium]